MKSGTTSSVTFADLSATQQKVLRAVAKALNGRRQMAGYGSAPYLSASRALMRRGLLNSWETGVYVITKAGKAVLEAHETSEVA